MDQRRFVIPDVHGCAATLRRLVTGQLGLTRSDRLYLLGDLVDRGPDSKGVLDFILDLRRRGYSVAAVRGNHEEMLLDACRDRNSFRLWLLNGGHATLDSFGVEDACEIPLRYRQFLAEQPDYLLLDDYLLVHACLDCTIDDPLTDRQTMLWGRSCSVDLAKTGGRRLVTGHTSLRRADVEASLKTLRITLDNGCVYRGARGLGSLTALELNTRRLYFQENCEGE
ncbi:MAG TPA: metallophosphoesterase [Geobacteraceae bacterium]